MPLFKTDEVLILKNTRPKLVDTAKDRSKPLFHIVKLPSNGIVCECKNQPDSEETFGVTIKALLIATNCFKDSFCLERLTKNLQLWNANLKNLEIYVTCKEMHLTGKKRYRFERIDMIPLGCLFSELPTNEQTLVTNFSNFNFEDDEQKSKYSHANIDSFIKNVLQRKEKKLADFAQGTDLAALYRKLSRLKLTPYPQPTPWGTYENGFMHLYNFCKNLGRILYNFNFADGLRNRPDTDPLYSGWIALDNYQKNVLRNFAWEQEDCLQLPNPASLTGKARETAEDCMFTKDRFNRYGITPLITHIEMLKEGVKTKYGDPDANSISALFDQWIATLKGF